MAFELLLDHVFSFYEGFVSLSSGISDLLAYEITFDGQLFTVGQLMLGAGVITLLSIGAWNFVTKLVIPG